MCLLLSTFSIYFTLTLLISSYLCSFLLIFRVVFIFFFRFCILLSHDHFAMEGIKTIFQCKHLCFEPVFLCWQYRRPCFWTPRQENWWTRPQTWITSPCSASRSPSHSVQNSYLCVRRHKCCIFIYIHSVPISVKLSFRCEQNFLSVFERAEVCLGFCQALVLWPVN